jgi:hypothetical protein
MFLLLIDDVVIVSIVSKVLSMVDAVDANVDIFRSFYLMLLWIDSIGVDGRCCRCCG